MFLMDTNALFAALHEPNIHNAVVMRWLTTIDRYASCGMTQIGTFRLLLTPASMSGIPLKPRLAHEALADFTHSARHYFLMCPPLSDAIVGQTLGHRAAADDYLVQIANASGCRLATLDRALAARWPERTVLIA
jgi:predicted nucleic acid-binding protein